MINNLCFDCLVFWYPDLNLSKWRPPGTDPKKCPPVRPQGDLTHTPYNEEEWEDWFEVTGWLGCQGWGDWVGYGYESMMVGGYGR